MKLPKKPENIYYSRVEFNMFSIPVKTWRTELKKLCSIHIEYLNRIALHITTTEQRISSGKDLLLKRGWSVVTHLGASNTSRGTYIKNVSANINIY